MTTWTSQNKSTVEKSILCEDSFILLCEDGNYLLQEDTSLDWSSGTKNTASWSGSSKTTTVWSSTNKN